jgi:hypothetical protein
MLPSSPPPDDQDWTWVLQRPCPQCGFDARTVEVTDLPEIVRAAIGELQAALGRAGAAVRPAPEIWSALEYGAHVRDVCRIFDGRLELMLTEDDPLFANWDQDATALDDRYWEQSPPVVAAELGRVGAAVAARFGSVAPDQRHRPGRRSNGSTFTVETLGQYFAHDLVHHVHDVTASPPARETG